MVRRGDGGGGGCDAALDVSYGRGEAGENRT